MKTEEYDAKIDAKRRITLHGARFDHYHVKEYTDGHIELEPRVLLNPFEISERTLKGMDKSIDNLKKGKVGKVINLKKQEK